MQRETKEPQSPASKRTMRHKPVPIAEVLSELMSRRGFARVRTAEAFADAWSQAAGELMAGYTRVGEVRRGKLEVIVANSTLVQELTFQKPAILKRLGEQLPGERIRDLRFRVGAID